jgi:hypothetical protein
MHFELEEPRAENVKMSDIAYALGRICRFNGHLPKHYSVAEHSVLVARELYSHERIYGLLHDAAEAYLGDFPSPVKKLMNGYYEKIEAPIMEAIYASLKIKPPSKHTSNNIHDVDMYMRSIEGDKFGISIVWEDKAAPPKNPPKVLCLSASKASALWLGDLVQILQVLKG